MRRKQNNYILSTFVLATFLVAGFSPCLASTLADADELLLQGKYKDAEDMYRELVGEDATGDAYAGLVVALAKQLHAKVSILDLSPGTSVSIRHDPALDATGDIAMIHGLF